MADKPRAVLSVTVTHPALLVDIQQWVDLCAQIGMDADIASILIDSMDKSITARVYLDTVTWEETDED